MKGTALRPHGTRFRRGLAATNFASRCSAAGFTDCWSGRGSIGPGITRTMGREFQLFRRSGRRRRRAPASCSARRTTVLCYRATWRALWRSSTKMPPLFTWNPAQGGNNGRGRARRRICAEPRVVARSRGGYVPVIGRACEALHGLARPHACNLAAA